jgi:AmmeMemoRadiSam system protein A
MFTHEQQQALLRVARQAIVLVVTEQHLLTLEVVDQAFNEERGAFVTLTRAGQLRGCIGYPEPHYPLQDTIIRSAVSAALHDPRFPPVTPTELPDINIEISVLSPLSPATPEAVEVGRHGLVIEKGHARGLLLPQVPVEWGWSRDEFLAHLCRKAGLPTDAWQWGASLFTFTAEVFSEKLFSQDLLAEAP